MYICIMKTTINIKISKEVIRKMEKTAHREALVENGFYGRPTHKVHKSVKDYTRKVKHRKGYAICD